MSITAVNTVNTECLRLPHHVIKQAPLPNATISCCYRRYCNDVLPFDCAEDFNVCIEEKCLCTI